MVSLCDICVAFIFYDDLSAVDYYYCDREEADEVADHVRNSAWLLTLNLTISVDSGDAEPGSCDCCERDAHVTKHRVHRH